MPPPLGSPGRPHWRRGRLGARRSWRRGLPRGCPPAGPRPLIRCPAFTTGRGRASRVLLEREGQDLGPQGRLDEALRGHEPLQVQAPDEHLGGSPAVLVHGDRVHGLLGSAGTSGHEGPLALHHHAEGVQVLRAGVERAEGALAAVERRLLPRRGLVWRESDGDHGLVRFHVMTQQVPGAQVGAAHALVASVGDLVDGLCRPRLPLD